MGVYHWGEFCRERAMAVRACQRGVGIFHHSGPAAVRAGVRVYLPPLMKNANLFGVRINECE